MGDYLLKRREAIAVLREILIACESQINLEMVWIKGLEPSDIHNVTYKIVMKAKFDEETLACVAPIKEKYRLKMEQEDHLWVFTKENGSERIAPSASTI